MRTLRADIKTAQRHVREAEARIVRQVERLHDLDDIRLQVEASRLLAGLEDNLMEARRRLNWLLAAGG